MEENTNCQDACQVEEEKVQEVTSQPEAPLPPPMKLNMMLNPLEGSVEFTFAQGETKIMQMKMRIYEFERMTIDMLKTVKDYNLFMAKQYQQRIDDAAKAVPIAGSVQDSCDANCGDQAQSPQS